MELPSSPEALLQAMVRIDTVNGALSGRPEAERPLAEYLEAVAQAWGLGTERLPVEGMGFNLLVRCGGTSPPEHVSPASPEESGAGRGAAALLFESHLDTVGVEGMSVPPFAAELSDGRVYGRGAADTKGSGAAMLWALGEYARQAERPRAVAVLFVVDEECAKTGVRTFVGEQLPGLGWRPEGVIVGEPTGLQPVIAHNGVVRWPIRTRGVAAHSSDPRLGRSAISAMARVVLALEARYAPALAASHPLTGRAQCSINQIAGGTQINIIPALCEIRLDRRIVPGEAPEQVLAEVEAVLDELRRDDPSLEVEQGEPLVVDPALDPRGGEALAAEVLGTLRGLGVAAEAVGGPYGTDASTYAAAGIAALVLGPGNMAQAHTADEWLAVDALHQGVAAYGALMRAPVRTNVC